MLAMATAATYSTNSTQLCPLAKFPHYRRIHSINLQLNHPQAAHGQRGDKVETHVPKEQRLKRRHQKGMTGGQTDKLSMHYNKIQT